MSHLGNCAHGNVTNCYECAEDKIAELEAKLAFMTSERDYLLEVWVHESKPAPYTPECYTEISDEDYPPVPDDA